MIYRTPWRISGSRDSSTDRVQRGYAFISGDALGENAKSCDPRLKLCPLSLTHLLRPFSESDNALVGHLHAGPPEDFRRQTR